MSRSDKPSSPDNAQAFSQHDNHISIMMAIEKHPIPLLKTLLSAYFKNSAETTDTICSSQIVASGKTPGSVINSSTDGSVNDESLVAIVQQMMMDPHHWLSILLSRLASDSVKVVEQSSNQLVASGKTPGSVINSSTDGSVNDESLVAIVQQMMMDPYQWLNILLSCLASDSVKVVEQSSNQLVASGRTSDAVVDTSPYSGVINKFTIDEHISQEALTDFHLKSEIEKWVIRESKKNGTSNNGHGKSRCVICQIDLQIKYEDHREMASHKTTFIDSLTNAFHESLKNRATPQTTPSRP
ncbi:hypothetical protein CRE_11172 [Caenorhabditis remanei]|uniref:Uncharacterized protein n=1 Tax=Caenorhabditis remanei TaxID=31234 RepID=E3MQ57_CAERE|nr:hypothetical protein CRE_11172 [Caenorhabditis remanei]